MSDLTAIEAILRRLTRNNDLTVTSTSILKEIPGLDSLKMIHLMVSIEQEFKIRFTTSEILQFKHLHELTNAISAKKKS